jgi:hypothetical protein
MTRLLLVAAALVVMLAVSVATGRSHPSTC